MNCEGAAMKVHCRSHSTFFATHAICGKSDLDGSGAREIETVSRALWPWIPMSARCRRCERVTDDSNALACLVTPEIELAVETALHQLAAQMQT